MRIVLRIALVLMGLAVGYVVGVFVSAELLRSPGPDFGTAAVILFVFGPFGAVLGAAAGRLVGKKVDER